MPFDLNNPNPPETYDTPHGRRRRYWPYPESIENLAYTPQGLRSWGSITTVPDAPSIKGLNCNGKCIDPLMNHHYPENFLHEQVMLENPTLLAALKNTPLVRQVPTATLDLISPQFVHKSKKSQFHLVVPQKYRRALCKITDNLAADHGVHKKVPESPNEKAESGKIESKKTGGTDDSIDKDSKTSIHKKSLTYIVKNEGLLKYVRRKVKQDLESQELRTTNKRFFPSEIEFKKNQDVHSQNYNWDKRGGMEALCVNYPGLSLFNESPSEIIPTVKSSEHIYDSSKFFRNNTEVMDKIPADMMKLFLNAPQHNIPPSTADTGDRFTHYGLLESAKADALETCLKRLYRRERNIKLSDQLMKNVYGPLKGMPKGYKFQPPQLPDNLEVDCPPLPEELEKVDRVMKLENKARRSRKARGVESIEEPAKEREHFSKPMLESSENENLTELRKSAMTLEDYPIKHNERNKRDSSDSLFCQVGAVKIDQENEEYLHSSKTTQKKQSWLDDITAKSSAASVMQKVLWQKQLESESVSRAIGNARRLPSLSDMSTSSPEESEAFIGDYTALHETKLLVTKDSRDSLPYPDIKLSAIRVPSDADGIADNWLYQTLAQNQRDLSSTDSREGDNVDNEEEEADEEETEEDLLMNEDTSDASVALDKIFRNVQPLLAKNMRPQLTASKSWSQNVD